MARSWKGFGALALGVMALIGAGTLESSVADAKTKDGKYLIYYSMSYVGNAWQAEAKNAITAMSKTAAYRDKVELRVQASGANAQRQIEQINAMIQAGADAIVAFPISPTALNGVIKTACDKKVVFVAVNGVTEPCAYNVKMTGSSTALNKPNGCSKRSAARVTWCISPACREFPTAKITGRE